MDQSEWIGLADGVYRANGQLTYWALYTMALRQRIESRRQGKHWQIRTASLDRYLEKRTAHGALGKDSP